MIAAGAVMCPVASMKVLSLLLRNVADRARKRAGFGASMKVLSLLLRNTMRKKRRDAAVRPQ